MPTSNYVLLTAIFLIKSLIVAIAIAFFLYLYIELPEKMSNWLFKMPLSFTSKRPIQMCPKGKKLLNQIFSEFLLNFDAYSYKIVGGTI